MDERKIDLRSSVGGKIGELNGWIKKRQERLGQRKIDEKRLITGGKRYNYGVNKSNQIKSNQIKSNQISNQIKSNQIKSNQIKSNQIKSNQIKSNQINLEGWCKIKTVYSFSPPEQFLKIC